MKKLTIIQMSTIKGSGCYKHLRRMDRDVRRGNDAEATQHFRDYFACMASA